MPQQKTLQDSDPRLAEARVVRLADWARQALRRPDLQVSVASADASFRRYFRMSSPAVGALDTWIVMDAPPEKEDVGPFIQVAKMLESAGVHAPRIVAENLSEGFLLLTDLGDRTYLAALAQRETAPRLYTDALRTLVAMQVGCARYGGELPPYDAAFLDTEMQLFPDWFLTKHLQLTLSDSMRADLVRSFAVVAESALAQPRVFVHRDYHSRNLMVLPGPSNPGVLDFQDARYGPITYDLVSVLRDCYIEWPVARVHDWVREFRSLAVQAGLTQAPEQEFLRWFDLMGVQRHLKVAGIFARLWHRDGKAGYLKDLPLTLHYLRSVLPGYPELESLRRLIDDQVMQPSARIHSSTS